MCCTARGHTARGRGSAIADVVSQRNKHQTLLRCKKLKIAQKWGTPRYINARVSPGVLCTRGCAQGLHPPLLDAEDVLHTPPPPPFFPCCVRTLFAGHQESDRGSRHFLQRGARRLVQHAGEATPPAGRQRPDTKRSPTGQGAAREGLLAQPRAVVLQPNGDAEEGGRGGSQVCARVCVFAFRLLGAVGLVLLLGCSEAWRLALSAAVGRLGSGWVFPFLCVTCLGPLRCCLLSPL